MVSCVTNAWLNGKTETDDESMRRRSIQSQCCQLVRQFVENALINPAYYWKWLGRLLPLLFWCECLIQEQFFLLLIFVKLRTLMLLQSFNHAGLQTSAFYYFFTYIPLADMKDLISFWIIINLWRQNIHDSLTDQFIIIQFYSLLPLNESENISCEYLLIR